MKVSVQRFQVEKLVADAIVMFVHQDEALFSQQTTRIQQVWPNATHFLKVNDFTGVKDTSAVIYTGSEEVPRVILVGLGLSSAVDPERVRRASAMGAQKAVGLKCAVVAFTVPVLASASNAEVSQALVEGASLGTYVYDKWISKKEERVKLRKLVVLTEDEVNSKEVKQGAVIGEIVSRGVTYARDLANAPSNELDPAELVRRAEELREFKVTVNALDKKQLQKLGMGGLLGVNQGSAKPPFMIILEWNGGKKGERPLVLVGKGITFDSGGISIKPAVGMGEMKMDMGGAAAVLGTLRSIAELHVPVNVIGLIPTTENMPSGTAYKPGDVLRFMNGKTAEIDNTDAEGRLVLADALVYAERFNPSAVIDLATLTGACVIALGNVGSALLGNDDLLNSKIISSGLRTYDRVVELPLWEEYEELIRSDIADVKNSGGRAAGTITAALFLQHFIGQYKWAHLDIAGTAMVSKGIGYINKGGTGAPVRLLVDLIQHWDLR